MPILPELPGKYGEYFKVSLWCILLLVVVYVEHCLRVLTQH
jgi:hypothetical protein